MIKMNVMEQIKRYEELDARVTKMKEEVQREKLELEYDKKLLKEKMDLLKQQGIQVENISGLENMLEDLTKKLAEVLDATERKLQESDL